MWHTRGCPENGGSAGVEEVRLYDIEERNVENSGERLRMQVRGGFTCPAPDKPTLMAFYAMGGFWA